MTRHSMRKNVFILIFESFFTKQNAAEILEIAEDCEFIEITDEITDIFTGIMEKRDELDLLIKPHLKKWTLARISKVSLAILRLAFYELTVFQDIDPPIIVNEAVELAKEYSVTEDASFINGVLGNYLKNKSGNTNE